MAGSKNVCPVLKKQASTIIQDADTSLRIKGTIRGVSCVLVGAISFSLHLGRTWSYTGVLDMLVEQSCCCKTDSLSVGVNTLK